MAREKASTPDGGQGWLVWLKRRTSTNQDLDMTTTLTLVIYMAILAFLTSLVASLIRVKGWTFPGTRLALGNRDNLPEATPFAGRAERTARNTFENFVVFAAIALVAHAAGATSPKVATGAEIFLLGARALHPGLLRRNRLFAHGDLGGQHRGSGDDDHCHLVGCRRTVSAWGRHSLARRDAPHQASGRMFWFMRKKFVGSYLALIC